jgi:AcrR family transcriptional regulator
MVKAFSEKEKRYIRARLKDAAKECLGKFGVRKTTIDQLVEMTGISKGAFYKFYPSKEVLFFSVFEDYQNSIIGEVIERAFDKDTVTIEGFTELIYKIYNDVGQSFIMNIIKNQEFEYLIRKLPGELIIKHHSFDDILAQKIFSRLEIRDDTDIGVIAASLRAVFMCMLHIKEIGEKDFDRVLKLLIRGLVQQIVKGASSNE